MSYNVGQLTDSEFFALSHLSDASHLREAVRNILVPRIVGTSGHKRVRDYLVNSLRELQWSVELNSFYDTVPTFGKLQFHNIIARLNPHAERYLVLACHYDSKYIHGIEFLGATDSCVPCAMLLNLAEVLKRQLQPFRDSKLSLMLIFFDGEEAFEEWSSHDSIYGARHLASNWESNGMLDRLELLVLLDLIGAASPKFYSFFRNTDSWHTRLIANENRLAKQGLLENYNTSRHIDNQLHQRYFQPNSLRMSHIDDDHTPFLKRGVPILHVIPVPFPAVWHTKADNASIVDYTTTENIARIMRLFTMEYLLIGNK